MEEANKIFADIKSLLKMYKETGDEHYNSRKTNAVNDVDKVFREKWSRWTEAFRKGFQGGHITWK